MEFTLKLEVSASIFAFNIKLFQSWYINPNTVHSLFQQKYFQNSTVAVLDILEITTQHCNVYEATEILTHVIKERDSRC